MDTHRAVMTLAVKLAEILPSGVVEMLAQAVEASAAPDWRQVRAQLLQRVPQPQVRALVERFASAWQQAPGLAPLTVATMLRTATTAVTTLRQEQDIELVWTGPLAIGVAMRRTDQALLEVIGAATQSLLVVSFAVYNIPTVAVALVQAAQRGVTVRICVEAPDLGSQKIAYDTIAALGSAVTSRAAVYVWPADRRPTDTAGNVGSLHAKCAVADERLLFVSSANLTRYALQLNIELGVLITGSDLPRTVVSQFDTLIAQGQLQRVAFS